MNYRDRLPADSIVAHDNQKNFSAGLWTRVLDQIASYVRPGGIVLDVGVGSGVVAARVAEREFEVFGIDFNDSMLVELRRRAPSVACATADVRRVPIATEAIDAVVVTNVLHLLEDWQSVVDEAARVLRRGGVLFVSLGGGGHSEVGGLVNNYFRRLVPDLSKDFGPRSEAELAAAAERAGLRPVGAVAESEVRARSIRAMVDRLEMNIFTWPPGTRYELLKEAARQTRSWVEVTYGSEDHEVDVTVELRLSVFRRVA